MHTIHIPAKNITLKIPETVAEFTTEQYLMYCKLAIEWQSGEISYFDLRLKLLYYLMGISTSKKKITPKETEDKYCQIYQLSLLCNAFFPEENVKGKKVRTLDFNYIDNKLPHFTHKGKTYKGPADAFTNLTFGEHLAAAPLFEDFTKTKNEDSINQLVAILYREEKPKTPENVVRGFDGDQRQPFYPATVEARSEAFKDLSMHYKFAVYSYFGAVSSFITNATEVPVLGKVCDFTPLFKGKESSGENIGRLEVLFALSKTKVFGSKQETEKELYWNVLLELLSNHLETERIKQNQRNDTNK